VLVKGVPWGRPFLPPDSPKGVSGGSGPGMSERNPDQPRPRLAQRVSRAGLGRLVYKVRGIRFQQKCGWLEKPRVTASPCFHMHGLRVVGFASSRRSVLVRKALRAGRSRAPFGADEGRHRSRSRREVCALTLPRSWTWVGGDGLGWCCRPMRTHLMRTRYIFRRLRAGPGCPREGLPISASSSR